MTTTPTGSEYTANLEARIAFEREVLASLSADQTADRLDQSRKVFWMEAELASIA